MAVSGDWSLTEGTSLKISEGPIALRVFGSWWKHYSTSGNFHESGTHISSNLHSVSGFFWTAWAAQRGVTRVTDTETTLMNWLQGPHWRLWTVEGLYRPRLLPVMTSKKCLTMIGRHVYTIWDVGRHWLSMHAVSENECDWPWLAATVEGERLRARVLWNSIPLFGHSLKISIHSWRQRRSYFEGRLSHFRRVEI